MDASRTLLSSIQRLPEASRTVFPSIQRRMLRGVIHIRRACTGTDLGSLPNSPCLCKPCSRSAASASCHDPNRPAQNPSSSAPPYTQHGLSGSAGRCLPTVLSDIGTPPCSLLACWHFLHQCQQALLAAPPQSSFGRSSALASAEYAKR